MEGQKNKIQYPRWHKSTIGKWLWGGADDEIPQGDRKVRGNINKMEQQNSNSTLKVMGDFGAG